MEQPNRLRFTINDYESILEKGILTRSQKVEFVRGELFCILPTSESHNVCSLALRSLFSERTNDHAEIVADTPIRLVEQCAATGPGAPNWRAKSWPFQNADAHASASRR